MKKQPEITDATRNAFIDAFCKLYEGTPIEKISIQQVSDAAGYNRTTFYHYFNDIYNLLTILEDIVINNAKKNIQVHIMSGNIEHGFILSFIKIFDGSEKYIKVLLSNSQSARFIERLKTQMFTALIDILHLPKDDVKVIYILDSYLSAVLSVISRWTRSSGDISQEELGILIRDMLTKGVLAEINKLRLVKD